MLRIMFTNQNFIELNPFYYGRKHYKNVLNKKNKNLFINKYSEENAYEKMFQKKRTDLLSTQEVRFKRMISSLNIFQEIEDEWVRILNQKIN